MRSDGSRPCSHFDRVGGSHTRLPAKALWSDLLEHAQSKSANRVMVYVKRAFLKGIIGIVVKRNAANDTAYGQFWGAYLVGL